MDFLFATRNGGPMTDRAAMDASILEIRKAARALERERERVEREEPRLIKSIQTEAKKSGNAKIVKVMAKDLVRKRAQRVKLLEFESQMGQVETNMRTMQSMQKMTEAMQTVGRAMASANKRLKLPELSKIVMNFQKQMATMDMQMEMMDDAISDANENEEEETDAVVEQTLDEIGVDVASLMSSNGAVPTGSMNSKPAANLDADLKARFNALKDP